MKDLELRLARALAGRYQLERELGAGGMATVFLARDERHGRSVAIKVLRQDLAESLGAERFHREVRIAAALQHPHVVPLYDSGDADGLLYYVMPFVDGVSLRQKLQDVGELPIPETVRVLRDIADALTAAHDHGVVHRDLKPENVMLTRRHALVTDFGVAKALSEATEIQTLTASGVALGTPAYMAPEQVSADPDVDHRADIYAFGVMAYEMLTGRPPFKGGTPQETLAAHLTATPDPVATYRPAVPASLAELVTSCLEKRPADRIQKAEDLVSQLEGVLSSNSETARTLSQRLSRRIPTRLGVGLIAIMLLAIGGAIWLSRAGGTSLKPATVLVTRFGTDAEEQKTSALSLRLQTALTQALQRIGVVEVVDASTSANASGSGAASTALKLASELNAGLVVIGQIVVREDSVEVQAKLLSSQTGAEVVPVPAEVGTFAGSAALIMAVTERIKGAVLLHRDPRVGADYPGTRAPTYEAYREYQRANDLWNSGAFGPAAERFQRSYQLDTTFLAAAIQFAVARRQSGGGCVATDSIDRALEPRRSLLSPAETQVLNRELAGCRGDLRTFVNASRDIGRLAPASHSAQYLKARSPLYMNLAVEARNGLLALDVTSPQLLVAGFYNDLTDAFHKLGDHKAELRWAREWQRHPRNQQPIRALGAEALALAALGDTVRVRMIFPQFLTTGVENIRDIARGIRVLEELRWHRFDSVAKELSRGALAGMGRYLNPEERVRLMTYSGDVDGAIAVADSMRRVQPDVFAMRWTGMLAAARGDRAGAEMILRQLETDASLTGLRQRTFTRALILALLGERELATRLLQQAHSEGVDFLNNGFHAWFGLEPLRGFAPFEAFVKPK